jgi:uncharacterized protein (DUF58 family)
LALAQVPDFRGEVALVHVDAEVLQGGVPVDGLSASSFRVTDNGKPQPIVNFGHGEERLDVLLLLDTSDSMQAVMQRVAATTRTALSALKPGDRVAVMSFDCDAGLIADFSGDFAVAQQVIADRVRAGNFKGCSHIQKSLADAAVPFRWQGPTTGRRAIVIVTDDAGSQRYDNAVRSLWEVDAVVLGVIVNRPKIIFDRYGIREIVQKTGGDSIATADAGEGLVEMIRRLRSRYSLYYSMPQGKPGSERKVKVELTPQVMREHPGAVVRARTGYVVP